MKIRPNDYVLHNPTGEEWVVCGINYEKGYLVPCGYTFPSMAKITDCELTGSSGKPQDDEQKEALRTFTYFAERKNGKVIYIKQNDFGGHFSNKVKVEITKEEYNRAKANGY